MMWFEEGSDWVRQLALHKLTDVPGLQVTGPSIGIRRILPRRVETSLEPVWSTPGVSGTGSPLFVVALGRKESCLKPLR